ncbi:MAG: Ig domain-containing protein, partial [Bacteroidia bacterium]
MKNILLFRKPKGLLFWSFSLLALLISGKGFGQVSMTTSGSYSQDFNTLPNTGSPTWVNNSTLANWYAASFNSSFIVDNGGNNAGGLKSYGTTSTSERALGSLGSSSATPAYGIVLRNTSGTTITDIKVTYTGEQWRNGGVTATQPLAFYYATSSSAITSVSSGSAGYTAVSALNFTSKVGTITAAALDGNNAANRTTISNVAIPGLSLANNSYIILKWDDINDSGNDHGLSIDDLTISWTVCTPQVITAISPSTITKTFGDASYSVATASDSGLTISYTSSNTNVATVDSSGNVSIVGAGTATITASQAGNGTYCAASDVTQALTVNKATSIISGTGSATDITFGQTLANSIISGFTANTPGTFAFTAPATA